MMWVECCRRCKKATISIDHVARKKSCSACGLECVYEDEAKNDNVRLGDLTNPLQSKSDLSIVTTEPKNGSSDDFLSHTFENSQNRGSDSVSIGTTEMNTDLSDEVIVSIAAMSDRLGLPATVKASEFFKKVEAYYTKGKSGNALIAGCIYIACRAIEFVAWKLSMDINLLMDIKPVDFIKRFCSYLGMDSREVKAVQIAAGSYECGDRSPVSVAAVFVYAFFGHSYGKKLLKELGEATGVSEQTLGKTYKDMRPYLSTVLDNT